MPIILIFCATAETCQERGTAEREQKKLLATTNWKDLCLKIQRSAKEIKVLQLERFYIFISMLENSHIQFY